MEIVSRVMTGLLGVGLVMQAGAVPRWPKQRALSAQICVERPGDNGSLNIRPADVVVGNTTVLTLLGEAAACAFVAPGKFNVWVQSRDPYDPASRRADAWKSQTISLQVGPGDRVELEVCGTGRDATYSTWMLQRAGPVCR